MESGAGTGRDRTDVPLARPEAHMGLMARPERDAAAGTDGAGQLGQLRHGLAVRAPRGGSLARGGVSD